MTFTGTHGLLVYHSLIPCSHCTHSYVVIQQSYCVMLRSLSGIHDASDPGVGGLQATISLRCYSIKKRSLEQRPLVPILGKQITTVCLPTLPMQGGY